MKYKQVVLWLLVAVIFGTSEIYGQSNNPSEKEIKLEQFQNRNGEEWKIHWERGDRSSPRIIHGGKSGRYNGQAHAIARQFLLDNSDIFFARGIIGNLKHIKTIEDPDRKIVFLQQKYKNLLVEGAAYKVIINNNNEVEYLAGTFYEDIDISTTTSIDENSSIKIALTNVEVINQDSIEVNSELIILPNDSLNSFQLTYRVEVLDRESFSNKLIYVSAINGDILLINDLMLTSYNTEANNPKHNNSFDEDVEEDWLSKAAELITRGFESNIARITDFFEGEESIIVDGISSATTSSVNPVQIYPTYPTDSSNPLITNATISNVRYATSASNLYSNQIEILNDYHNALGGHAQYPFNYAPSSLHFDEINTFYHLQDFMAFLNQFGGNNPLQLEVRVNSLCSGSDNNACYSPTVHRINFGNASYDGNGNSFAREDQIIYHEYTHALFAYRVTPPSGISGGHQLWGINEGNSDYFAGAYSGRSKIGTYGFPLQYIRDMANPNPDNDHLDDFPLGTGSSHDLGELFSSILWDIRTSGYFTTAQLDRAAYNTLSLLPVNSDFEDYKNTFLIAKTSYTSYMTNAQKAMVIEKFGNKGVGEPVPLPSKPINVVLNSSNPSTINWASNPSNEWIKHYKIWRIAKSLEDGSTYSPEFLGVVSSNNFSDFETSFGESDKIYKYAVEAVNQLNEVSSRSFYTDWSETGNGGPNPWKIRSEIPEDFYLGQNYPNPFNPSTTVEFGLSEQSDVKIQLFDVLGNLISEPVNEFKNAGTYSITINGDNLASGLYIIRMYSIGSVSGEVFQKDQKLNLIK